MAKQRSHHPVHGDTEHISDAENGNGEADEHTSLLHKATSKFTAPTKMPSREDGESQFHYLMRASVVSSRAMLFNSYVNVLLPVFPIAIVAGVLKWNPMVVFVLNFLAIVPLAGLLAYATDQLAQELGETIGGLVNATFGNVTELLVSILALREGQIRVVQASMLGSILSNTLLVLGCSFLAGGWNKSFQEFNAISAGTMGSLLTVASAALIIPSALFSVLSDSSASTSQAISVLSKGTSIILLLLYFLYLYFQLGSHKDLFKGQEGGEEEEESHFLSKWSASVWLVIITVAVAFSADFLVDAIDAVVEESGLSKTFIGLVLIPIVGNAAEHATAVIVSVKDKMDLAIGVALGSSLQIALGLTPLLVLIGWAMGQPMTLHFATFETIIFFISVVVVNYLLVDGKSTYLEGAMLLAMYIIIGLAFYVYPDDAGQGAKGLFASNP